MTTRAVALCWIITALAGTASQCDAHAQEACGQAVYAAATRKPRTVVQPVKYKPKPKAALAGAKSK